MSRGRGCRRVGTAAVFACILSDLSVSVSQHICILLLLLFFKLWFHCLVLLGVCAACVCVPILSAITLWLGVRVLVFDHNTCFHHTNSFTLAFLLHNGTIIKWYTTRLGGIEEAHQICERAWYHSVFEPVS
jgi:hypothetical protein